MKKLLLVFLIIFAVIFVMPVLGLLTLRLQNTGARPEMISLKKGQMVGQGTDSYTGAPEPMMGKPAVMYDRAVSSTIAPIQPPMYDQGFTQVAERSIVRTAFLSLIAEDTRQLVDQITAKAQQFKGVVTNTNIYEAGLPAGAINADLTLRIPVDQLDSALKEIKALAVKVTSENLSAEDRTEQKVDLEAQLRNLRATEEQMLGILKQAKTVEETLRVQQEVNQIRTQIERTQAQLDNVNGAVAMSQVHISISTKESELPVIDPDQRSFMDELKLSLRQAVSLYRELSIAGLRLFIIGLPIIIIGGVLYLIFRKKKVTN